jgi:hypothetical protein
MRVDQTRGCRDQISVVACRPTVRQQRDVFQPSTDTVPCIESPSIDCPTRHAITVVNLLQGDARGHDNVFHLGSVLNGGVRISVKRLDKDAATPACQSGKHESSRIINTQQSSLDTDASGQQQLAKLYNSRFALIRGNKVRHFLPCLDNVQTLSRVSDNRR